MKLGDGTASEGNSTWHDPPRNNRKHGWQAAHNRAQSRTYGSLQVISRSIETRRRNSQNAEQRPLEKCEWLLLIVRTYQCNHHPFEWTSCRFHPPSILFLNKRNYRWTKPTYTIHSRCLAKWKPLIFIKKRVLLLLHSQIQCLRISHNNLWTIINSAKSAARSKLSGFDLRLSNRAQHHSSITINRTTCINLVIRMYSHLSNTKSHSVKMITRSTRADLISKLKMIRTSKLRAVS